MDQNYIKQQEIHLPNISVNFDFCLDENKNDFNLESENGFKSNSSIPSFSKIPKFGYCDLFNHHTNMNQTSFLVSNDTSNVTKNIFQIEKPIKNDNSKFLFNNLLRRVKKIVFDSIMKYDNLIISKLYNNIGDGVYIKKLFRNNHFQTKTASTSYNQVLLNKTQKEIFSEKISSRYSNYPLDHNEKLINKLFNEKDEVKRKIFENLFNKSLLQCIEHLSGKKRYKELDGLEKIYESEMKELDEDEEYKNKLKYILNNVEKLLNDKKQRKNKTKKENN